ncbi:class F sortase [Nocardioides sp. SYSU DS0663]|uniref:class F sortase n=1 Tax=Nocardioides sp. SYSU DS0663 TaxID=3416445 RepID=UPI003F4C182F
MAEPEVTDGGEPRPRGRRLAAVGHGIATGLLVLAAGLTITGVALPSEGTQPGRSYVAPSPAQPIRLLLPTQDVVAPVVPIGMLPGRVLQPPADPDTVGWWDVSARPGAHRGQTVVTGHTVHTGGGALDHVPSLGRGDPVRVETREGTVRYKVQRVQVLTRGELAARAERLFGQDTGRGRLVLVSCTDWNGEAFENNVVVLARAV